MRRLAIFALAIVTPAAAQNIEAPLGYATLMAEAVPVTSGDITDRPYRVISRVDKVASAGVFGNTVPRDKLYKELWEKGRRVGADAVVRATYGAPFVRSGATLRQIEGDAVKFLTDAEIAALPRPTAPAVPGGQE